MTKSGKQPPRPPQPAKSGKRMGSTRRPVIQFPDRPPIQEFKGFSRLLVNVAKGEYYDALLADQQDNIGLME